MSTKLRPDEIASVIKKQIEGFESALVVDEVGTVLFSEHLHGESARLGVERWDWRVQQVGERFGGELGAVAHVDESFLHVGFGHLVVEIEHAHRVARWPVERLMAQGCRGHHGEQEQ